MLRKSRFSTRIALVFSAISMMSIIVISLASLSIARTTLLNRTQDFIHSAVENQVKELNLLLLSAEKTAQSIADEVSLTLNTARFQEEVDYREQYLRSIEGAVRLSAQINSSRSAFVLLLGEDSNTEAIWFNDDNRDGIPERQAGTTLLSNLPITTLLTRTRTSQTTQWISHVDTRGVVTVFVSIFQNDKLVGLAGSDISADALRRELENGSYLKTGRLWLTDAIGSPLLTPFEDKITLQSTELFEMIDAPGLFYENTSDLWTFAQLYNQWLVFSSVSLKDVLEGLDRITLIIAGAFLLVTILTLLASVTVSRRIAEPYSYLTEKIAAIGTGDYAVAISEKYLKRFDEAGVLSRAIATTQKQLVDSFAAIQASKDNLEIAVRERTAELLIANQQLEAILIDMRETQNQLALTEKMASLSRVLVGLSHNINTPLGNALTLVTYYEEKQREILQALQDKSLSQRVLLSHLEEGLTISGHLYENIQTGRSYIEKVSDISRVRQTSQPEIIQLATLIQSQFILAQANNNNEDAQLILEFPESLTLVASPQSLAEIVYELLDNALVHAKTETAALVIRVTAKLDEATGLLRLSLMDNGIGLSQEERKDIFTPLVTSQLHSRSGLGLSRVYRIVSETFKGTIEVSALNPQGTAFNLCLYCRSSQKEHP